MNVDAVGIIFFGFLIVQRDPIRPQKPAYTGASGKKKAKPSFA
jgi:hypothetical protein